MVGGFHPAAGFFLSSSLPDKDDSRLLYNVNGCVVCCSNGMVGIAIYLLEYSQAIIK